MSRTDDSVHLGYLDGWRGLAILALLVGHFFPVPGVNLGTVGVNLFFVLSGLLMGGLLFEKKEPLDRFYRRRIARILPAHVTFLAITALIYWCLELPLSSRECLAALLFVNNYVLPADGPGTAVMPYGHIWSLAVEEHSYIVLSLVALASRRGGVRASAAIGALFLLVACCAAYYQWLNPPKLLFSQWLHTEVAAYPLLGTALWVASRRPLPAGLSHGAIAPGLLLIGVALHLWSVPPVVQRLLGVGCFVVAICVLSATRSMLAAALSWTPLRLLGLWSFSLYLWQQPFYIWVHREGGISPLQGLGLGLILGLLSYYVIERPARSYLNSRWGAGNRRS